MLYNSIIDTVGNTPLIRLNKVNDGIPGKLYVKVEYFNPGNSSKDRIALKMIEDAEKEGLLKPGGTIIEGTSGNTGMGLALIAIKKGYRCIFTTTDKQSQEKIDILKAVGAEVMVCPTNVDAKDSRSYYSVAKKLSKEIKNSFYPDQYDNASNTKAHYETTGPEIWSQTSGKITHYVATVGTGGSLCGAAQYLKEKKPKLMSIGIDAYGSVLKKYKETGIVDENEIYPYLAEGYGEDMIPKNVHFNMIDLFLKVTDKESALMTRRLAREEGLFVGWSSGAAVCGALKYAKQHLKKDDMMVVFLPDHGTRYLNKIYNDNWMKDHGFLDHLYPTAKEIIHRRGKKSELHTIEKNVSVEKVIALMNKQGIDQAPIIDNENIVGSVSTSRLVNLIIKDASVINKTVGEVMENPMPFVAINATLDVLSAMLNKNNKGVLVRDTEDMVHIITQHDILKIISS